MEKRETITLHEKLSILRSNAGFNQGQVATYLNVDQSYVSKLEKGERVLTSSIFEKLCSLYGVDLHDVMCNEVITPKKINISFRKSELSVDDLNDITNIKKIVLNLKKMNELEKGM